MKLLMLSLLFVCFSFGMDFYPETYALNFYSIKLDSEKISADYCDSIMSLWPKQKLNDDFECSVDDFSVRYNSPEDPSIFIIVNYDSSNTEISLYRTNQVCKDPFQSIDADGISGTVYFSDVLFVELMRMQRFGIIFNNHDSLENFLKSEIKRMKSSSVCDDIEMIEYDEFEGSDHVLGPSCCSLVEKPLHVSSNIGFGNARKLNKIGRNTFIVYGNDIDEYRLFDFNGKLLYSGKLYSRVIKVPILPSILKINGEIFLLK